MNLIQYLISSSVCLGVSYLAFRLIFNKEFRFKQQRAFLLASLAFSLLLPMTGFRIDLPVLLGRNTESVMINPLYTDEMHVQASPTRPGFFTMDTDLLMGIYAIISAIIISIAASQFFKILWLYRISIKTRHEKGIILCNDSIKSPFSFFRWIFIPGEIVGTEERESIIIHESIHVSQYHSFDNLLIELVAALTWFNPLVWMLKKSLHLVHEYLADEGTLGTGIDSIRYRALLINQVSEERLICLSSSFNNSLLKKRMIMMTKSKTTRQNKSKILTLLPLSVILFLIVSTLNGFFPRETKAVSTETIAFGSPDPISAAGYVPQDTVKNKPLKVKVDDSQKAKQPDVKVKVVKENAEKIGTREKDEEREKVDVEVMVDVTEDVDIKEDIDIQSDIDIEEDVDVQIDADLQAPVKIDRPVKRVKVIIDSNHSDSVIYIVDGKKVKKVKDIDSENIESVSVMKDDNLVIIRTKEKAGRQGDGETSRGKVILPDNLLYIIDGVTVERSDFEKLDPDQIESMSVIKGKTETSKYTDKDYEGVIKVITKTKK